MAFFYDPETKKPQVFAMVVFVLVPVILIVLGLSVGKNIAEKNRKKAEAESAINVFDKF